MQPISASRACKARSAIRAKEDARVIRLTRLVGALFGHGYPLLELLFVCVQARKDPQFSVVCHLSRGAEEDAKIPPRVEGFGVCCASFAGYLRPSAARAAHTWLRMERSHIRLHTSGRVRPTSRAGRALCWVKYQGGSARMQVDAIAMHRDLLGQSVSV